MGTSDIVSDLVSGLSLLHDFLGHISHCFLQHDLHLQASTVSLSNNSAPAVLTVIKKTTAGQSKSHFFTFASNRLSMALISLCNSTSTSGFSSSSSSCS